MARAFLTGDINLMHVGPAVLLRQCYTSAVGMANNINYGEEGPVNNGTGRTTSAPAVDSLDDAADLNALTKTVIR
ncbi:hypothetical protein [Streptomyces sioyaensis]|uniref:hypothetical protein n=1 Tax=Streptomyces sioyaensis TaxID=67364 RepID=UPI0037B0450F